MKNKVHGTILNDVWWAILDRIFYSQEEYRFIQFNGESTKWYKGTNGTNSVGPYGYIILEILSIVCNGKKSTATCNNEILVKNLR